MLDIIRKIDAKKTGIFAAGVLAGTAGVKLLASKDAKKVYTHGTAAVLRAKECVMKTVTTIQENVEDIYAEAQQINEDRAAQEMEFADEAAFEEEFESDAVSESDANCADASACQCDGSCESDAACQCDTACDDK